MSQQSQNGNQLLATLEALSNPHRMRIISILLLGRQYVSQLSRNVELSRPLLYMHLKKLEAANLVKSELELSEDGKAMKYYELTNFSFTITPEIIAEATKTLTIKKGGSSNE
ncbi:ArsR/SmtB family transcription factor [Alkalihalobacillus trypoxylicola]|uniref:ArsR family transcriptional regulator n=1 Tax=Alkalihalobacillus trypoxylicola TaxID=519424 RepID=A0A162F0E0_9BACI|nr:winged helix-turn-helix domain-containing protein [Alkalihalobacillus trypoxylicola]KYG34166.1 ArsR family transcriptional regulator [Alkalihalobacillus trypoxylicola]